jgi:uncharacterized protein (DUF983 family)
MRIMAEPTPAACGLKGLCPRCAAPTLFAGVANVAERCRACGLDFAPFIGGDRLAALLTLIVAALIASLAIAIDGAIRPPFWLHLAWVPLTVAAVIAAARFAKGMRIGLRYRSTAGAAAKR